MNSGYQEFVNSATGGPRQCGHTDEGLTINLKGPGQWLTPILSQFPSNMPAGQALAVASVLKRMDCATVHSIASPAATYGGRPEGDLAWQGITVLLGALAGAGFVAREG
jgi:hypothetical protein